MTSWKEKAFGRFSWGCWGDGGVRDLLMAGFAGCRPNSIYFCQGRSMSNPSDGSVYVFVFSLNDRTVTPLYPYSRPPLLWISPKFVWSYYSLLFVYIYLSPNIMESTLCYGVFTENREIFLIVFQWE